MGTKLHNQLLLFLVFFLIFELHLSITAVQLEMLQPVIN